jgi:hypothetical protein
MESIINDSLINLERCFHYLFHFGDNGGMLQDYQLLFQSLDALRRKDDCPENIKEKLKMALKQLSIETLNRKVQSELDNLE